DVETLSARLVLLEQQFGEEPTARRRAQVSAAREAIAAAAALGADTFKRHFFKAVETKEWEEFAQSVHALAKKEGAEYPSETDHCLLCERPLDGPSIEHIKALLTFVEGEARKTAEKRQ